MEVRSQFKEPEERKDMFLDEYSNGDENKIIFIARM